MEIKSNLNLYGGLQFERNCTEFPEDPEFGTLIRKDDRIYIYELVDEVPTWHCIGDSTSSTNGNISVFIYEQNIASDTWIVSHNKHTTKFVYNVFDSEGKPVLASAKSDSDGNTITLYFRKEYSGHAIFVLIKNDGDISGDVETGNDNKYLYNVKKIVEKGSYCAKNRDCLIINSPELSEDISVTVETEKNAVIIIRNFNSGNYSVSVSATSGEIDGYTKLVMKSNSSITLICDGEDWYTVKGYIDGV